MNLKFWKKIPPQDEADDTPPGLLARLKTRVSLLTERFKPTPPFQAEVTEDESASASESPDTNTESPEIAIQSGMIVRMRTVFSAALQWIKTAASPDSGSRTKLIVGAGALLLTLLGIIGFAAWKFMSPAHHAADSAQHADVQKTSTRPIDRPASEPVATLTESNAPQEKVEDPLSHAPDLAASAPIAIAPAIQSTSATHATSTHDKHPAPAETHLPAATEQLAPASLTPEAEIAKLRKEKAELQKKLNDLRNEKRKAAATNSLHSGKTPALGGSVTVPSNDPKATVDTLKSAIDAMNAGTGDFQKKPAK